MTDAIYMAFMAFMDFEGLKTTPPAPILLGVLKDLDGQLRLDQIIVADTPTGAAAARRGVRHARLEAAVEGLLEHDCPIVGWSFFDRDVIRRSAVPAHLEKVFEARYVNALQVSRAWRARLYPRFTIARGSRFDPRHTLDKYAALAGYPHVDKLRGGKPTTWIRRVQAALKRTGKYRSLTKNVQKEWRALLDDNAHDLKALRAIWSKASCELGKWREYEEARYCVDQDRGRTICVKAGASSAELDALLVRHGAMRWAFITAWNPASLQLTRVENDRRQADLLASLSAGGYQALTGRGIGADTSWRPEESLLVLDISTRKARQLGRQFGQFAIVTGSTGAQARLVSCAVPVRNQACVAAKLATALVSESKVSNTLSRPQIAIT